MPCGSSSPVIDLITRKPLMSMTSTVLLPSAATNKRLPATSTAR
jgi:hypothetical protein